MRRDSRQTRSLAPRRVSSMHQPPQEHAMYARSTPLPLAVVAALAFGGCGGAGGKAAVHETAPTRSCDVVTLEELSRVASASTFFAEQYALRHAWFVHIPKTVLT